MLNTPEIIMILVLALILFGAKKLPELARGLGHGIKEFKKATRDVTDELQHAIDSEPSPPPRRSAPIRSEIQDSAEQAGESSMKAGAEATVPQTSPKS